MAPLSRALRRWPMVAALSACLFSGCALHRPEAYAAPRVPLPGGWSATGGAAGTPVAASAAVSAGTPPATSAAVSAGTLSAASAAVSAGTPPVASADALAGNPSASPAEPAAWWRSFRDPVLDQLVDRALAGNANLAAAAWKVRAARLTAGLSDTNLSPDVAVSAGSTVSRDLKQAGSTTTHQVTGTASYELDLWGRLASVRDASRWEAEATEADRQSAALALVGTTATLYWQVAYLNQRIATSQASISYLERTLALVRVKWQSGAVSSLDSVQAAQTLAAQRATRTDLLRQREAARTSQAILFGQPPENPVAEAQALPEGPDPGVAAGLPASLLGRRPDLRAAEFRLRSAWAGVQETRASFYPAFSLTGSLGSSSPTLLSVLQNPVATLGAGLTLPFLQWNTARLTLRISQASYAAAVDSFRQTLYQALADVETALAAADRYQSERVDLAQALDLARQAEGLAEVRYRAGATGLQTWLDAQEARRSAESALAAVRLSQLDNLSALFQALGG